MSTRSNIYITGSKNRVWIYRHHDGYPAGTGSDLARTLKKQPKLFNDEASFLNNLLALRYEKASYEKQPKAIFEITNDQHGDIEWLYKIKFIGKRVRINVSEYRLREEKWIEHGLMSEKEFRSFVAKDLLAMRQRIKELIRHLKFRYRYLRRNATR